MAKPGDLTAEPPQRRTVTLADVAHRAGVSRATASLVLRDSKLVAAATRGRVQAAVAKLGYIYNRGAANLRASRTKAVGLLVCEIVNPFNAEFTVGVDQVLDEAGYVAFLANTAESLDRQGRFLRRMREQNVDGILLCPAAGTPSDLMGQLSAWQIPCVQALRRVSAREGDYAGADYAFGVVQATEHLIRLGHRRIAFVGGERGYSAFLERRAGFLAAMRRNGLPTDLVVRAPPTRHAGADAIAGLLDRPDAPTAAMCFNDIVACGVMVGLQRRGLRPGRDVAVIGMDDGAEAEFTYPALTSVATSPRRTGEEAARLLLRRIAVPAGTPERIILPTRLIVRESCGATAPALPARRGATSRQRAAL
jgi:LacI family transcriptional regulator